MAIISPEESDNVVDDIVDIVVDYCLEVIYSLLTLRLGSILSRNTDSGREFRPVTVRKKERIRMPVPILPIIQIIPFFNLQKEC